MLAITEMFRPSRTNLLYLLSLICASSLTFLLASFWEVRAVNCDAYGYRLGAYMASCSSPHYGDFEHGAIAFQLEPAAIKALQASDAVYLGFSYGMVSLSTMATERYFAARSSKFYNLGFSGEFSTFYDDVLPDLNIHPKLVVIDVEPFFTQTVSAPAKFLREHPLRARIEYMMKYEWQKIQKTWCEKPSILGDFICGPKFAMYRNINDGRIIIDYGSIYGRPLPRVPIKKNLTPTSDTVRMTTTEARAFLARHGLSPSCTILFAAPNSFGNQLLASSVATNVGAQFVDADAEGLATVDSGHLDLPDAERWSERFWMAADPIVQRCLMHPS